MIRILCFFSLILWSLGSHASSPILEEILTPELAARLGFTIDIEVVGDLGFSIDVIGPSVINHDCRPFRTGNVLTEKNGNQIAAFFTDLPVTEASETPKVIGFISNEALYTSKMFIDYRCPERHGSDSRRYLLPVTLDWKTE